MLLFKREKKEKRKKKKKKGGRNIYLEEQTSKFHEERVILATNTPYQSSMRHNVEKK